MLHLVVFIMQIYQYCKWLKVSSPCSVFVCVCVSVCVCVFVCVSEPHIKLFIAYEVYYCSKVSVQIFLERNQYIYLFSKDTLNRSKVTRNIYISIKVCFIELSIHQRILKESLSFQHW